MLLNKYEWETFLNFWISDNSNFKDIEKRLEKVKQTKDKDLSDLIEIIEQNYK